MIAAFRPRSSSDLRAGRKALWIPDPRARRHAPRRTPILSAAQRCAERSSSSHVTCNPGSDQTDELITKLSTVHRNGAAPNQPSTASVCLRWEGSSDQNSNFADARAPPARAVVRRPVPEILSPSPNLRTRARAQCAVLAWPNVEILPPSRPESGRFLGSADAFWVHICVWANC